MIKILFFIDTLTGGGAEKVLRTLVNNIDQTRFDITVHTVDYTDPEGLLAPGIRYRAINKCKTSWGRKLFSYWYRICAELKWLYPLYIRDDYDIEVAYLECGPTKIIAGSTNRKAKKVAWVHCDLTRKEGMSQQTRKLKRYYAMFDRVVCVSENVRDGFLELIGNESETEILYNAVDEKEITNKANMFSVQKDEREVFLSAGRLTRQKGFDRLVEACALLKREDKAFCLKILGEGPERECLEEQIRALHLENCVTLMGFADNPYPYIKASDVLVCSSRYEGFSTVVTEALILGKPVVTTPCTGMQELLGDSQYGLITEDSVEGLYKGMKKFLEDPELRKRYAEAALKRGAVFSCENAVKKTERFFAEILEK